MTDKHNDATCLTRYDPDDARYKQLSVISVGANKDAYNWRPDDQTPDVATLFMRLSDHREGKKDGPAFVTGDMVKGRRLKTAIKALYAVGLDIDNGTPSEEVDAKLIELGCAAIRYTTHSHLKDRTEFKKDVLIKFAPDEELGDDLVRRYLRERANWHESIVASASYGGTGHTERGIMVTVAHAPMAKNRVVIPFAEPFVIAKEGATQQAAMGRWTKVPLALAERMGIILDKTGTDPSRLFYFPRHAANRPFEVAICGGPLFDWRSLELDDPLERLAAEGARGTGKSTTPDGKALGGWSRKYAQGFQIADLLRDHCEDRIRGNGSTGVDIECPFDEEHSDAGEPDDRACQATNAGDSSAPVFSIRCQHDSCRNYTNLDHLGRMILDDWFGRDVLTDENYNSTVGDAETLATDNPAASGTQVVVADGYGGALAFDKHMEQPPKGVTYDKETGQIHPTYRNALLLIGSEYWDLGYNELSQNYGLRGLVEYPWPEHLGYALNDAIRREIRLYMLRRWGVTFKTEDVYEATMTLARRNTFNPVVDYLQDMQVGWDGVPRVDRWLESYLGVKVTECECKAEECECGSHAAYVRAIGKIVLMAAVRRARRPGCKFDEILILEGEQGAGKSTAVRILGGEWFGDSNLGDLKSKSAPMKLRGVWMQEIAELTALNRAETNELKEFTSQQIDRYRLPYAKSEDDFPRRCIFIGTVNPGGGAYLVDLTGNRRFWPVACGEIDVEGLARDRDQLWAEAATMEAEGDVIRLDPSLYGAAKKEQEARLADDPWREILMNYLDDVSPPSKERGASRPPHF